MTRGKTMRVLGMLLAAYPGLYAHRAMAQASQGAELQKAAATADQEAVREAAWDREILAITDLLIDGHYGEARARATRLLADPKLPQVLALRTHQLRDKADAKLGRTAEPAGAQPPPRERIFPVQLAVVGRGFGAGVRGWLRVSSEGVSFSAERPASAGWTVRWPDFAAAQADDGVWDAPYPLAILERDGKKHFFNRLDGTGRYQEGGEILEAIAKARQSAATTRATSGAGASAAPGGAGGRP
jgi:hypothetical protein